MKTILLIYCMLLTMNTYAGVYKCTDDSGNTSYQAKPCAGEIQAFEVNIKTGSTTDLRQQQDLRTQNLQELEHKRQQELKQKQQIAKRNQDALAEIAITRELIQQNPKQYSVYAIPPYYPDNLSSLVQQFAERLPEIERLRRLAAQKALASGQCHRVEADELNTKSNEDELVFLVDCSSGKSFYFNETELTSL